MQLQVLIFSIFFLKKMLHVHISLALKGCGCCKWFLLKGISFSLGICILVIINYGQNLEHINYIIIAGFGILSSLCQILGQAFGAFLLWCDLGSPCTFKSDFCTQILYSAYSIRAYLINRIVLKEDWSCYLNICVVRDSITCFSFM